MSNLCFKTHNECVDYLIDNFYNDNFIDKHSRKDLVYILSIIESHQLKVSPYAFTSMCKKRMCAHIDFYLNAHMKSRLWLRNLLRKKEE